MEELCAKRISGLSDETMWVEYGKLAKENNACNLGSGFPNFPLNEDLKEELHAAAEIPASSWYARAQGHVRLVQEIATTYSPLLGRDIDPMSEIQVTIGAYQGIYWTFQCFVEEGDEVIVFDPSFDGYLLDSILTGARIVPVSLLIQDGGWVVDKEALTKSFTPRTKMLVLITPHNPTSKIFTRDDLEFIAALCKKHNCILLADEVYERVVFEGHQHISMASLPGMWERTITLCSAGKMFCVTGWRIGWAYGPANMISKLFRVCVCDTFGCPTILQEAVAGMLARQRTCTPDKSFFRWLNTVLRSNYAKLSSAFNDANMPVLRADGGFFMVVDHTQRSFGFQDSKEYDESDEEDDVKVAKWIVRVYKLALLPLSLFYHKENTKRSTNHLRVCFAKSPDSVDRAVEIIRTFE